MKKFNSPDEAYEFATNYETQVAVSLAEHITENEEHNNALIQGFMDHYFLRLLAFYTPESLSKVIHVLSKELEKPQMMDTTH